MNDEKYIPLKGTCDYKWHLLASKIDRTDPVQEKRLIDLFCTMMEVKKEMTVWLNELSAE